MRDMEHIGNEGPLCVGLGEVLFDLLPGGARLGGAPANFAYAAGALGLPSLLVSAVGEDALGRKARRLLEEKGLPALLPSVPRATGRVEVALSAAGVPSYAFAPCPAYEAVPWTAELEAIAARTAVVSFGTLAQWGRVSRETVQAFLRAMPEGSLRVYDVNLRGHFYNEEIVRESIGMADAVKCNEDELPVLAAYAGCAAEPAAYAAFLRREGVRYFLYTEGERQSSVFQDGEVSVLATPMVEVADTVGAGDAFTAGLVAALVRGAPLRKAHAFAAELAAYVCTCEGAMPDYPAHFRERLEAGL